MRVRWLGGGLLGLLLATLLGVGLASAKIIGPPEITNVSATIVPENGANLFATIAPHGHATTYQVWLSYSPCKGGAGECAKPRKKEEIAKGKIARSASSKNVTTSVKNVTPGCTYAYWFVAKNSSGTVESELQNFTAVGEGGAREECQR